MQDPMTDPTASRNDLRSIAQLLKRLDICMLTTHGEGGVLHGRPMSNNGEVEWDGDSWFFTETTSRKVDEIEADDRVELAFIDSANATWVNVEGHAEIVRDDVERKRDLWQADLERWFPNGPDDAGVALIKVSADHIDSWSKQGEFVYDRPGNGISAR